MFLLTVYGGQQLHRSPIRGLIIECKWVFNVKFQCIVYLRLHKVENLMSNSNLMFCASVIDAYDQALWSKDQMPSPSRGYPTWQTTPATCCEVHCAPVGFKWGQAPSESSVPEHLTWLKENLPSVLSAWKVPLKYLFLVNLVAPLKPSWRQTTSACMKKLLGSVRQWG